MFRPLTHRDIDWLFERVAALSRFVSHIQQKLSGRGYRRDDPLVHDVNQVHRALTRLQMTLFKLGIEHTKDEMPGWAERQRPSGKPSEEEPQE